MAIARDTSSQSDGTGTTLTWAHTCTGTNLILFVMANTGDTGANTITGVTYNGVAMTSIGSQDTTQPMTTSLWYLVNPATGSNNVVITSSASRALVGAAVSYTGAKQTGVPDSQAGGAFASSTITQSTTTVADNSWLVGGWVGNRTPSAGANTTSLQAAGANILVDSNGAKSPAGSYSLQITQSDNATSAFQIASFAPFVAAAASSKLTLLKVG